MLKKTCPLLVISALIVGTTLFMPFCKSADSAGNGEELEGWRVIDGEDYYYMRIAARASDNAEAKSGFAMLRQSCVESTQNQAADKIIRKMIGENVTGSSTTVDGQTINAMVTSLRQGMIKGIEMKECAPRGKNDSWLECECVHFVHGKDLKKAFSLKVQEMNAGR